MANLIVEWGTLPITHTWWGADMVDCEPGSIVRVPVAYDLRNPPYLTDNSDDGGIDEGDAILVLSMSMLPANYGVGPDGHPKDTLFGIINPVVHKWGGMISGGAYEYARSKTGNPAPCPETSDLTIGPNGRCQTCGTPVYFGDTCDLCEEAADRANERYYSGESVYEY